MMMRDIDTIHTGKPFDELFPIRDDVVERVTASMRASGYDPAHPIQIAAGRWQGSGVVCDGHTRLRAAKVAGIEQIPAIDKPFASLEEAVRYSVAQARDRHNRSDPEFHSARKVVDRYVPHGGDRRSSDFQSLDPGFEKSAAATAAILGTSRDKVEQSRAVEHHPDLDRAVGEGELSLHAAMQEARRRNRGQRRMGGQAEGCFTIEEWQRLSPEEAHRIIVEGFEATGGSFNEQDNDKIGWAGLTLNIVTGCMFTCSFCYARENALRFKFPHGFAPTFYPRRLGVPFHTKVPARTKNDPAWKNVFVCSEADLFGKWVPREWIQATIDMAHRCPQYNFLFLTKSPKRYADFKFPENAWLGATVIRQADVSRVEEAFADLQPSVKWLSVEPMLEPLRFGHLDRFHWIVIGGASRTTSTPEWRPPFDWYAELHLEAKRLGLRVFQKGNLHQPEQRFPADQRQNPPTRAPAVFFNRGDG